MRMTLGERLKGLREKFGWTQVYVSKKLGLKRSSTYANYEYGIRDPDTDTLSRLAEIYETTTDYLLNGERINGQQERNYENIMKEIKAKYPGVDLTDSKVREKLMKAIDLVLDDYEQKQ